MAAASLHQDILVSPSLVSPSLLSSIRENSGNTRPSACTNRIVEDHTCVLEIYIFLFFPLFFSISFKEDESSSRNRLLVGPVAISLYLKRRPTGVPTWERMADGKSRKRTEMFWRPKTSVASSLYTWVPHEYATDFGLPSNEERIPGAVAATRGWIEENAQ